MAELELQPMNSMVQAYFPITEPEGRAQSLAPYFPQYQALRDQLSFTVTFDKGTPAFQLTRQTTLISMQTQASGSPSTLLDQQE